MARPRISTIHANFSKAIRLRDQECVICGVPGEVAGLDCSHYVGRRHSMVRFFADNAAAMCRTCHGQIEPVKGLFADFLDQKIGRSRRLVVDYFAGELGSDFNKRLSEVNAALLQDLKDLRAGAEELTNSMETHHEIWVDLGYDMDDVRKEMFDRYSFLEQL